MYMHVYSLPDFWPLAFHNVSLGAIKLSRSCAAETCTDTMYETRRENFDVVAARPPLLRLHIISNRTHEHVVVACAPLVRSLVCRIRQ